MKKLKYRIIQYINENGDIFYRAKYLALGFLWFYVNDHYEFDRKAECKTKYDTSDGLYTYHGILFHIKEHAKARRVKNYEIAAIEDIEV